MSNDSTAVDFGTNLLEEEIDDVIFSTNEFLTDATFTGGQGPFWWLPKIKVFPIVFYTENQLLTKSCPKVGSSRGTKMGQNLLKTYLAIFFHDVHVIKDLCYSFAKVHKYCETNKGIPLNLSFAVHFSATCTDNGIFG